MKHLKLNHNFVLLCFLNNELNLSKSLEDKLFFLKYINVDEYDFKIEKTTKYGMPAHIYYNLPGSADVTLRYLSQTISQNLPIAQYGSAVPLANSLFMGRPKFTILFNPETGNILSITK